MVNQGWEFALLSAWKTTGHGRIIGYPHATIRYWDLRYFFDPRSYNSRESTSLPRPDSIAVNGGAAMKAYLEGGYPPNELAEAEALRYLYLEGIRKTPFDGLSSKRRIIRLLVLCDYTERHTETQLRLLEQAIKLLPSGTEMEIVVKPHPICPVKAENYTGLPMKLTAEPLAKLIPECDIGYTSTATSAAIEVYYAGIPVISVLDSCSMNLSPLRDISEVQFVSSPEKLADALAMAMNLPLNTGKNQNYFFLYSDLPRWKKLLLEKKD